MITTSLRLSGSLGLHVDFCLALTDELSRRARGAEMLTLSPNGWQGEVADRLASGWAFASGQADRALASARAHKPAILLVLHPTIEIRDKVSELATLCERTIIVRSPSVRCPALRDLPPARHYGALLPLLSDRDEQQ